MVQLRHDHREFARRGAEIVVVGPDGVKAFARYWADHELPFIGLPDPQHAVLDLYGQHVKLLKLGRLPELVVVDRGGTVRMVHHGGSMSDIVPTADVLALLNQLNEGS